MRDPHLTITTLSGARVTAPMHTWLQELVLMLPPDDLVALMTRVQSVQTPLPDAFQSIPTDPDAYIDPKTQFPRRHVPRRT